MYYYNQCVQIPNSIQLNKDGQYCIVCFSGPVERIYQNGLTYYKCRSCGSTAERSLVIDSRINWWIDERNNYWHESAGVVIINQEGKILSLLRKIFPFSYTIPAGHVDKNEDSKETAVRELMEETGIDTNTEKLELLLEFDDSEDPCRRGSDHHKWQVYRLRIHGTNTVSQDDETSSAEWCDINELRERNNLTEPFDRILKTLGESLIN